ncbi:MAG: hypothetical protein H0X65_06215 [Gemmatimonadetes bacterium]|jgi:hypothetical protein|nr:hypothetical protein [Gemmatimonadota bacterium]
MDLRSVLDETLRIEHDHARRLVKVAALVSAALRQEGLDPVVVGGSAIEIHAPGTYTTRDIDLVVPERFGIDWHQAQERAFRSLGFERHGRHWTRDDVFVEIPSRTLSDPVAIFDVGPTTLKVIAKEVVLADRIVGFKYWGVTDYGLQAIALLVTFGDELDEPLLTSYLDREQARDAYHALRTLAASKEAITHERLQKELDRLRQREGGA